VFGVGLLWTELISGWWREGQTFYVPEKESGIYDVNGNVMVRGLATYEAAQACDRVVT